MNRPAALRRDQALALLPLDSALRNYNGTPRASRTPGRHPEPCGLNLLRDFTGWYLRTTHWRPIP